MSDRLQKPYIHIDSRTGVVEVVRGWPVQDTPLEVTFLLYTGSVGLIRSLLQLFPTHRSAIVEYLRDMADCIESSTW